MNMSSFRLFAGTDVGLRDNNEDNFTVCPDLSKDEWIIPANPQTELPLSPSGCMMVVADGMGGQNAGEVASAIAISTMQEMFSPRHLSTNVLAKQNSIKDYLKKAIVEADRRIKKHSANHSEAAGMGSTIVVAWLVGNKAYVAWLGDSRAYSFVPNKGISRISKDHSYVQKLVDAGSLTEQQAMEHPDSNVITRSLGDTTQKAKPDVVCHPVVEGEIILLCSDGLCGVCTDDKIKGILEQNQQDLSTCKEVLTEAALNAEGSDNITVALLQTVKVDSSNENKMILRRKGVFVNSLFICIASFIFLSLGFVGYKLLFPHKSTDNHVDTVSVRKDTVVSDVLSKQKKIVKDIEIRKDNNKRDNPIGIVKGTATKTESDPADNEAGLNRSEGDAQSTTDMTQEKK